ncbi:PREDICTED: U4/U6 small nuclear ribonucleoprotein Prp31-like [Amphimedon queenslandica]|uniref:U4/U6 small nuclear ribonucleoprotein Prp31 n=1 Tax=Amphimedon queenslandica TaxID=400682 RepID=A0A1X7VTA9_AMPQE|nr:PREDICTED: U4/U6 small nuclear ribonucleoprotein Prp31-like [Amphimedon queenslandica]|eukprot:XP_003382952.1 PREDICTED: U4/U6 small nuclear ribonucleoprotein Prp31-like [Amphimedon queenslandica]
MSLAEELLADLDDDDDEVNEVEEEEDDLVDVNNQWQLSSDVDERSVHALTKLNESQLLKDMMDKVEYHLGTVRTGEMSGPVEYDPEYQLIVESNNMVVEIDNEIYTIHKYVKDLYSKRFPELESMVYTPIEYVKTVQLLQNDLEVTKVDLNDILAAATIMVVSVTASTTQGSVLEESELKLILEACDMALELNDKKLKIMQYVESRMSFIAPNLSAIVGSAVAAKLIGIAGGLTALSQMPSCNIQVLGAQKRTLSGFSTAAVVPHTGFVYFSDLVQNTSEDYRKKAAKFLAAKCTLAARVDSCHEYPSGELGEKLRQQVEEKVNRLQEPPPVKRIKPLPKPDDMPKKRRGGKRIRRLKQKVILTDIRKQANRMSFAEIEDDAYQEDLGFSVGQLGKGGVGGPIRGPAAVDKKTQISISKRLQRQIQKSQVYGGRSTIQGATSGTASTIAFTPLQGLEIVNPLAAEKKVKEANQKYFSAMADFKQAKAKDVTQETET